ncbi:hypothetical protein B0J12DRAFT_673929 [Macrophomina phaseolina]|uniref:FAD-binding domain-containing protein n=1 Tax=Macrophomina phaseolina TaxID=35725 RepID=A0ABQ8G1Q0_9PEZI|nr:hypothetical protein B0J12DRAFT_673929 [Macrophomina phaseolina]
MKIIIVGAGISGLSTALFLRKHLPTPPPPSHPNTILICESHHPRSKASLPSISSEPAAFESLPASTTTVGGGLGIAPNGMRVLRDLDAGIHDAVAAQGFACHTFVFRATKGWTLGRRKTGGGGEPEEVCVASTRHGLWSCLMGAVEKEEGVVVMYRRVVRVRRDDAAGKVVVSFMEESDGGGEGEEEADLVVGADGTKSVVRKGLFGAEDGDGKYAPVYTGLASVGGFFDASTPRSVADEKAMVFTFGGNGFFGYYSTSPPSANSLGWWWTFQTDSLPSSTALDVAEIKAQLQDRVGKWVDPIIRDIVSKAEISSIYPTWILPDFPTWGEKGIVLIGDAAHAMSPTTGQGASQGLEDAQTLSLLLAETLKKSYGNKDSFGAQKEKEAVALALKLFYEIPQPRVAGIIARGKRMDSSKVRMGVVMEYIMYLSIWLINRFKILEKLAFGDIDRCLNGWSAREEV